jgi:hypothetical protein
MGCVKQAAFQREVAEDAEEPPPASLVVESQPAF